MKWARRSTISDTLDPPSSWVVGSTVSVLAKDGHGESHLYIPKIGSGKADSSRVTGRGNAWKSEEYEAMSGSG